MSMALLSRCCSCLCWWWSRVWDPPSSGSRPALLTCSLLQSICYRSLFDFLDPVGILFWCSVFVGHLSAWNWKLGNHTNFSNPISCHNQLDGYRRMLLQDVAVVTPGVGTGGATAGTGGATGGIATGGGVTGGTGEPTNWQPINQPNNR